ncbi:MAG: hypothetical protein FJ090_08750 [Deltaproteobacteria bacterium]|nr:hypothetical protein [Deltaproteobacteria bacterium]
MLLWLAVLLGMRFGAEHWLPALAAAAEQLDAGESMPVPPKPTGLASLPAPGTPGDGQRATLLSPATCEAMVADLRDVCWQSLARQVAPADPDEALRVCARVAGSEMVLECHADVAESIAVADRARAETICAAIESRKWRGQCFFGSGLALAETDAEYAMGRCAHAEVYQTFCRHDVVGEIALVDLPAAHAQCAREEGDWLTRKTCWHGIGKYLARRDTSEAAAACDASTAEWRGTCYHGVGWGGAERDADATLADCSTRGPYADHCRHGVAAQFKRADPTRAVALCESIQKADTRARCLDFVTR